MTETEDLFLHNLLKGDFNQTLYITNIVEEQSIDPVTLFWRQRFGG